MQGKLLRFLLIILVMLTVRIGKAEVTDSQVRDAIRGGMAHLRKHQRPDGSWNGHPVQPGGLTALCTLALINAGADVAAPEIQRALEHLRSVGEPRMVYSSALQTMVFCAVTPQKDRLLISRNVQWLENVQIKQGTMAGGWKYSGRNGSGDNSNSQFALLALHEAQRVGVLVKESTWKLAHDYWRRSQNDDGSWSYVPNEPPRGSMTCAGIASLVIAAGRASSADATVEEGRVQCCGGGAETGDVDRGLAWLADHFSVTRNPGPNALSNQNWLYYYLYCMERVGRLTGRRFIGNHDWFREGAEFLLGEQNSVSGYWRGEHLAEENSLIATSFALLFLSKGRRPVVISRLRYGEGRSWNLHRSAVQHLTSAIERSWERDLTWQTIDLAAASPEDLLQTPVLFISGRDGFTLPPAQREVLRQFVSGGGFIFAEAACGGGQFDQDFRELLDELFPESSLRLLPRDHPVWYAEGRVDAEYLRPLYGMEACCRTSVVYCPKDLSCYWELARLGPTSDYPADVQREVEACLQIGKNVVAYATNRELRNKLDRSAFLPNSVSKQPDRGVLFVPKLLYRGGGDDAPNALPNLLNFVAQKARLRVGVENRTLAPTDPTIFDYPVLFMHGRRGFRFSPAERKALGTYLERGGFVFGDAICANQAFADAFRREFREIVSGSRFERISSSHELFTNAYHGFSIDQVTLRDPLVRGGDDPLRAKLTQVSPLLEGVRQDGRLAVVLSPYDLSCALEFSTSLECKGYLKEDAARIGLNVILFALQQ